MTHARKIISVSRAAFLQACEIKAHDRKPRTTADDMKELGAAIKEAFGNPENVAHQPRPYDNLFNIHKE